MKKGEKHTKKTKKLMSIASTGSNNPMYGKCYTEEEKKAMSIALTGKMVRDKNPFWGRTHTDKTKKKISDVAKVRYTQHKHPWIGRKHTAESRKNISIACSNGSHAGTKNGMYGKKHSIKSITTMSNMHRKENLTIETRRKMSDAAKIWRQYRVLPVKDTKIEVKIQNFLTQLNITFIPHKYMKIKHGYQCDVFVPAFNLVIECDGDYWHKYPHGKEIDHIRTKELQEAGFRVARLWEREINTLTLQQFSSIVRCEN